MGQGFDLRSLEKDAARPSDESWAAWTPPLGTRQRIRHRAIWSVALFSAALPPAVVAFGIAEGAAGQVGIAAPLAFSFWTIGLLFSLWAAFPTLRYWEDLPGSTRWLGASPLLSVSLVFTAALIGVLFA